MELTDELYKSISNEQNLLTAKQVAYNYATYKPRTKKQIIQKLKEKGFCSDDIAKSLVFLKEFKLYDDYHYAEMFVKDYLEKKPSGKQRIALELAKRGVPRNIIDDVLYSHFPDNDTLALARIATDKKLRSVSYKSQEKQRNSLVSYLQRQGFSWDIIKKIIDEKFENNG